MFYVTHFDTLCVNGLCVATLDTTGISGRKTIRTQLPWKCHDMETLSTLLALCAGNPPTPAVSPSDGPIFRSFEVFSLILVWTCWGKKHSSSRWLSDALMIIWRHNTLNTWALIQNEEGVLQDVTPVRWQWSYVFLAQTNRLNACTMMTSSNGNIFRGTGPLCGEFTGPRWIPHTKAGDAELWCFLWSGPEQTVK